MVFDRVPLILVDGKSPANQLRLVVYPIIYKVFLHLMWLGMGFLNHQQQDPWDEEVCLPICI